MALGLWVCGFLGFISHAFKRPPSTSSGYGEHANNGQQYGDRRFHNDRHLNRNSRGGRASSHTGMASGGPQAAGSPTQPSPNDQEQRITPGVPYGTPPSLAQAAQYEADLQAGAMVTAAAIAAATQPATLVKIDRTGASRRTPLHVAAERGQLHVLSAIIESLCCAATASRLDTSDPGNGSDSTGPGTGTRAGRDNSASSGPGAGAVAGSSSSSGPGNSGAGGASSSGDSGSEESAGRRRHHGQAGVGRSQRPSGSVDDRPQRAAGAAGGEGAAFEPASSTRQQQQQASTEVQQQQQVTSLQNGNNHHNHHHHHHHHHHHQRRLSSGLGSSSAEEFPVARPGAGGAPLAPEQYIQFHLNMQDADGTTALSLACRFGHVDCCRLLLANGSARTLSDARGNTPLHYAALRGHLGVLFMLLDEFLEPGQEEELSGYVDARNHAGCTPLHYAVWGRQSGSVQVLLQHGADVLPRNSRPAQELTPPVMVVGSTPLHLAAARGHVEICRIILKTFAERVLEPLQLTEDDPQPATLASLDPRVQINANGHMPYQVAQRLGFYPLAMLLRPSIPVLRLFSDEERAVRFYGPAPLRAIAAEALNKKLLSELDALAAAAPAAPPQPPPLPARSAIAAPAAPRPTALTAAVASSFPGGARRPLSAPATLEQLAAAAALEAEEEARGGGGATAAATANGQVTATTAAVAAAAAGARASQPPEEEPSRTDVSPFTHGVAAAAAAAAAGGGAATSYRSGADAGSSAGVTVANSSSRRLTPPPPLQVLVDVSNGARSNAGARDAGRSPGPTSPPPLTPGAGPSGSSINNSALAPPPPRTPPAAAGGVTPISPTGISPCLVSPIAIFPPSPAGGPTTPTAHAPTTTSSLATSLPSQPMPQLQLPSRGASAHRKTPPLSATRSSNTMLSAAPIAAGMSRPPSAPRANGQQSSSPHGQVTLSLPGQPDTQELRPLVVPNDSAPAGSEPVGRMGDGAAGGGAASIGGGGLGSEGMYGNAGADGSGGGGYIPRTPVRQPSSGALHVRRLPTSPSGGGGAAGSPAAGVSSRAVAAGLAVSATAPVLGLQAAAAGEIIAAVSRTADGGRPAGMVRLRSNPLFEETPDAPATGGGLGAAAPASASLSAVTPVATAVVALLVRPMPSLAEDSAEGEDSTSSDAGAPVASSCVAPVTPFTRPAGGTEGSSTAAAATTVTATPVPAGAVGAFGTGGGGGGAIAAVMSFNVGGDEDEDLECGVCMEVLPMVAMSPCRHQVCGPCARRICCLNIQKPSHCPFCRATISAFVAPPPPVLPPSSQHR